MRGLKITIILALCSSTLSAGLILRSKVKYGEKEMVNVWYIQDGNLRWDTGEEHSLIYTSADNMLKGLDWSNKEYFAVSVEAFEKFLKDLEAKMKAIKEKVTIKAGPFGKIKKKVAETKEEVKVEKTGSETVAGFLCNKYDISIAGRKVWSFWTTDPDNLGIKIGDFKFYRKLKTLYSTITKQATQGAEKIENYPIKNILYDKAGNVVFSQELLDAKEEPIEVKTFQVPEDFQKKEFPLK